MVVEKGIPSTAWEEGDGDGSSETETADKRKDSATSATELTSLAATTESGYYEVRWEDIINIDVNKTRAKLTWTYNGTCVTSSTGSGYWWWQTATGWHLDDPGSYAWKTTSNCSAFTHANGHHWNSSFCFPLPITDTYAKDVRFRGGYKGGIGAYVGSVYKNDDCFPLHWADTLKRT